MLASWGVIHARHIVGRKLDVGALVEYQPNAVVSRTLIKKAAGTVTAFAGQSHAVKAMTRFKMLLVMIRA